MKNTGKSLIAVALIITTISMALVAIPIFANPLRTQAQDRDGDCPQSYEPCEDCEPKEWNHNYNYDYKDCGDCDCDGTMKQTRTRLHNC